MQKAVVVLAMAVLTVWMAGTASADTASVDKARLPAGPTVGVVADQRTVLPGGLVTVEVLASNVADLSVYQVEIQATGGDRGRLALEAVKIDTDRPEYVFGQAEVIKGEALHSGQAGAMQMSGSTNVDRAAYLATYTFRASADASGTFEVNLKVGKGSFLLSSSGRGIIAFRPGKAAVITVAEAVPERLDTREK